MTDQIRIPLHAILGGAGVYYAVTSIFHPEQVQWVTGTVLDPVVWGVGGVILYYYGMNDWRSDLRANREGET